jgi:hypothetical protein
LGVSYSHNLFFHHQKSIAATCGLFCSFDMESGVVELRKSE